MAELGSLLNQIPLPLAQLGKRALNAQPGLERHNAAFYLAEATLKLAAAVRVGRWLDSRCSASAPLSRTLEALVLPSLGHWNGFFRDVSRALAEGAEDPVGIPTARLSKAGAAGSGVHAFLDALASEGVLSPESARQARKRGLLGFFDALVSYRNEVIGHGAMRSVPFYQHLADGLIRACADVLADEALFLGGRLVVPFLELAADGRGPHTRWTGLVGLAGIPGERVEGVEVGHLYLLLPDGVHIPLHPLVVYSEDARGTERFGFLNRAVRKGGAEVSRADYLDYLTGETLADVDTAPALAGLLSRLRGHAIDSGEVRAVAMTLAGGIDTPPVEDAEWVGRVLGERFRVLRRIGAGGMGAVYEAEHLELPRRVAVKVLRPALASHPESVERFRREAREAAALRHPGIVAVEDLGRTPEGGVFLVMELLEGRSLEEVVSDGPAAPDRVVAWAIEALEALEAAHARGVVHRDIKPANLFLAREGDAVRLKILDFGIAKVAREDPTLTGAGLLGTPAYMAPEQVEGASGVDARADLYSLGATLYHLLTGTGPIEAATAHSAIAKLVKGEVARDPRAVRPDVPAWLSAVVARAMAADPAARFTTADEMRRALEAAVPLEPAEAPVVRAPAPLPPARPDRRWVLAGLAGAGLAGAAGAGWYATRPRPPATYDPAGLFRHFAGAVVRLRVEYPDGSEAAGTGFVAKPSGLVVTMDHVLAAARPVDATFADGTVVPVLRTLVNDTAAEVGAVLLDMTGRSPLLALPLATEPVEVGDVVAAIAWPGGGAGQVLREGRVTAPHPLPDRDYIGTSMPTSPGESGGPVLSERGEVVGMLAAIAREMTLISPSTRFAPVLAPLL